MRGKKKLYHGKTMAAWKAIYEVPDGVTDPLLRMRFYHGWEPEEVFTTPLRQAGKKAPPPKIKVQRKCLSCDKMFWSVSVGNRICGSCTRSIKESPEKELPDY